ncbi:MAG: pseudouridine synthase [Acidobacteriota bacterium]
MSPQGTKPPAGERLQKVLARFGVGSRRQVEDLIREGRITVNGQMATLGQRVDLAEDAVKVDGRRIAGQVDEPKYLLLNKPAGCVSTRSDPEGRATVIDLLPPRLRKGLMPVGRLDYDTEGLLILTNDGELAQHIAHPRYGCVKTYEAKVKGRPKESDIERLRQGVPMFGKRTAPAYVASRPAPTGRRESTHNSWWTVKLGEGKTRQIREMFFRIGHPVSRLRRVAIGGVSDPRLPRGSWRELSEQEVEQLRQQTAKRKPRRAAKPKAPTGDSAKPASGGRRSASPKKGRPGGRAGAGGRSGAGGAGSRGRGDRRGAPKRGGKGPGRGPKRGGRD